MSTDKAFRDHLRYALNHLYEPDRLRRSPLMGLLLAPEESQMPLALSRILTEAIDSLRAKDSVLPGSDVQRVYELLYYRYVQCVSQKDLARQLAVSVRQVRREQSRALAVLADHLRKRFNLSSTQIAALTERGSQEPRADEDASKLLDELRWLQQDAEETTSLVGELEAVVSLLEPLTRQHRVRLDVELGDPSADLVLVASSVALRQALLSLLAWAVRWASSGHMSVRVRRQRWAGEVHVRARRTREGGAWPVEPEADALHDAERLLEFCSATLALEEHDDELAITVGLPLQEAVPVLVIDDNKDTLQLMERYVVGSRYRVVPNDDPRRTLPLVEKERPAIIVLDIMMASLDGWQLLLQLREHPASAHCPLIVSTVLAQEDVALSLGASEFLRKPISRQAFLEALDRQYATLGQAPAPESPGLRGGRSDRAPRDD